MIKASISIGDALDRISILEIKKNNIKQDNKLVEINNELKELYESIKININENTINNNFHYKILKKINDMIWKEMDCLRFSLTNKENNTNILLKLYHNIAIEFNDQRYRVKKKINNLFNSAIKETKSYNCKTAFHIGDLGLGDQICQIGAIRYLATLYDKVIVTCKKNNEINMREIFSDDNDIDFYIINHERDLIPRYGCNPNKFKELTKNTTVFMTGCNLPNGGGGPMNYIVTKPYEYLNFNFSIFWEYFYIPETEASKNLYNTIKDYKYAFIHNTCSTGTLFSLEEIKNYLDKDILIINPCINMYEPSHKYYDIANKFIKLNICNYLNIIKNADTIILSDSSFFCFAINIEIQTNKCYYISRWHNYNHIWNDKNIFNNTVKRQVFKNLKIFNLKELEEQARRLN
jgi:hypothetical protein